MPLLLVLLFATRASAENPAAIKPLPADTQALLASRGIVSSAPIYIRIFKEESELEIWKARPDGRYLHIKTFPICNWSGALGPKQALGDYMAPEGFYGFGADGLKPDSKYHLALNVGYPNALDRSLGRSGDFIMVHGKCVSVGCFAMTDDLIEEVYALARDALQGGEERVPVHIFPFRMTAENMQLHASHLARASWGPLKEPFDDFARTQEPPRIGVCGRQYVVNPIATVTEAADSACPARIGKLLAPLSPKKARKLAFASTPLFADGPKTRTLEDIAVWSTPQSAARETGRKDAAAKADNGGLTPYLAQ
jgi:murein L,D-transpeptidase YafK